MNRERIIELGRKLLALAKGGVDGERETAQRMLDSFLEKNGLSLRDIEPATRVNRLVKGVSLTLKQVFVNFCASIVGHRVQIHKCVGAGYYFVEMNDAEWAEFSEKWPVYKREFLKEIRKKKEQQKKELKLVAKAFISKHDLYSTDRDDSADDDSLPTAEELEEIMQMLRLREEMEDLHFSKKLNQAE